MNKKRRSQLGQTASIAAPVLLVLGVRSIFSAGPADASAATAYGKQSAPLPASTAALLPAPAPALTHEQQHAMDWRATLNFDAPLESPMDVRIDVDLLPAQPVVPVEPTVETPSVNPLLGLVLTGTIGNQNAALAAISGKVYRIGDDVRPGWKLTSVDVRAGRIVLTAESGETVELLKAE